MRARLALAIAAMLLVLAACEDSGFARFETAFPAEGSDDGLARAALPVVLTDQTGLVTGIELGAPVPGISNEGIRRQGNRLVVGWVGGLCEDRARLLVARTGVGITIRVSTDQSLAGIGGCPAAGVLRILEVKLIEAIDELPVDLELDLG